MFLRFYYQTQIQILCLRGRTVHEIYNIHQYTVYVSRAIPANVSTLVHNKRDIQNWPLSHPNRRPVSSSRSTRQKNKQIERCVYVFYIATWRFPESWGYPTSWMVYFMENPNIKWMIWGYHYFRKPPHVTSR